MKEKINLIISKIKDFMTCKEVKITALALAILVVVFIISFSFYSLSYANKVFPKVKIGQIDFSGLTKEEVTERLKPAIEEIKDQELVFSYQEKNWQISPNDLSISYDLNSTTEAVYSIGRRGSWWQKFTERLGVLFKDKKLLAVFSYNKSKTDQLIDKITAELDISSQDASLKFANEEVIIQPQRIGQEVNQNQLAIDFKQTIGFLAERKVELAVETKYPLIYEDQLLTLKEPIARLLSQPIILHWENKEFSFQFEQLGNWLDIVAVPIEKKETGLMAKVLAEEYLFVPQVFLNPEKIKVDIGKISQQINKEPKDAKLTMSGGRATVFVSSQEGYQLDQEKTLTLILEILANRWQVAGLSTEENGSIQAAKISLPIEVKKPTISNETVNDLGIKELIGKGTTNFSKSPKNRIHNIKVGAAIFNGSLIKPGETFSALKVLGEVSAAQGFLPELVIKEDRTEPEIGGGLCQVSTTLFRAALNSGLPIMERTNHKYRVSYYEPPVGMDATIYIPSPDLKFTNNTPGYILIQSYVSGNYLTFEFYGTNDGRKIEISEPELYDITSPGEPLYIDDPSLAAGQTKRLERAHNGAKAHFYYKVTRGNEVLLEKTFYSKYVAWRAVYLRGPGEQPAASPEPSPVEQSQPAPEPTPSPTCTPNWTCGEWSQCTDGNQTRTCTDGCGDSKKKTQTCGSEEPGEGPVTILRP